MRCELLILMAFIQLGAQAQNRCAVISDSKSPTNQAFERWLSEKMSLRRSRGEGMEELMTVPVVFHVVHNGAPEGSGGNISRDRILDQLRIINEDFTRTNADASTTPEEFLDVAASVDIQFVLANRDPEGLPSEGITRTRGSLPSYRLINDAQLKSEIYWPADQYINIYIAELQGFLGWATFPFSNLEGVDEAETDAQADGVVIDFQYIGINPDTGGTFESFGRTLTHELGHYFGLNHVWGDGGCSVDDFCTDTPLSSQNYQDQCPSSEEISCESGDMYSNFLNYTDDFCMNLFTACQRERMRTVLVSSPRRKSLLSSPALSEAISVSNDLGVRRILTPQRGECISDFIPQIEVRNYGTNTITSATVELRINDVLTETQTMSTTLEPLATETLLFGEVTTDTESPHVFRFTIAIVNGGSDGNIENDTQSVELAPTILKEPPLVETFEDSNSAFFRSTSTEGGLWTVGPAPASLGSNNAAIANFHAEASGFGERHVYLLPNVDLSGLNSAEIVFEYAYGNADGNDQKDGLALALSRDCGATFDDSDFIYEVFGTSLKTTSRNIDGAFLPVDASEWQRQTINITQYLGIADLRFGIIAYNGSGNNIYLDNVELQATALNALDLGLTDVSTLPVVTCSREIDPRLRVRNYGFEDISSYDINYQLGPTSNTDQVVTFLSSGEDETQLISVGSIADGSYELFLSVDNPNGNEDQNPDDNQLVRNLIVDNTSISLPFRESFSGTNDWISTNPTGDGIWELSAVEGLLSYQATGFSSGADGEDHWLVSPLLSTGNMTYGSLIFKRAYAEEGTTVDRLRVLLSVSCGDRFEQTLVDLTGNELSTATGSANFQPTGEEDWEEVIVDISDFVVFPDLRIAFVYTNSNGRNLFIDDVEIIPTSADQLRRFESQMRVYPNPSPDGFFNVTLNLPRKDDVTLRLMDLSGKTILFVRETDALNQTYNMEAPGLNGVYLLKVEGDNTNLVERIVIGR